MTRAFAILLFVAAVAFAAAPFLTPGFGGFDPNLYPVPQDDPPVQPATWAFSIWGVIYLWLIASAAFGLFARADDPDWAEARPWAFASLAPGVAWLAVAQVSPIWATVLIWWMAITAIMAMLRAGRIDRWLQREAYAIHAGWLTAAASVSLGLLAAGWGLTGPVIAAVGALLVALAVALLVQRARRDVVMYPLAVIWALTAVAWKNADPLLWAPLALSVLGTVLLAARAWMNLRAERLRTA